MEAFTKTFSSQTLSWPSDKTWSLAGVVGSGNLEVLIEPNVSAPQDVTYSVQTSIPGFKDSWYAALRDFSSHYPVGGCTITIHDQGAAPIVITMRLRQALDLLHTTAP